MAPRKRLSGAQRRRMSKSRHEGEMADSSTSLSVTSPTKIPTPETTPETVSVIAPPPPSPKTPHPSSSVPAPEHGVVVVKDKNARDSAVVATPKEQQARQEHTNQAASNQEHGELKTDVHQTPTTPGQQPPRESVHLHVHSSRHVHRRSPAQQQQHHDSYPYHARNYSAMSQRTASVDFSSGGSSFYNGSPGSDASSVVGYDEGNNGSAFRHHQPHQQHYHQHDQNYDTSHNQGYYGHEEQQHMPMHHDQYQNEAPQQWGEPGQGQGQAPPMHPEQQQRHYHTDHYRSQHHHSPIPIPHFPHRHNNGFGTLAAHSNSNNFYNSPPRMRHHHQYSSPPYFPHPPPPPPPHHANYMLPPPMAPMPPMPLPPPMHMMHHHQHPPPPPPPPHSSMPHQGYPSGSPPFYPAPFPAAGPPAPANSQPSPTYMTDVPTGPTVAAEYSVPISDTRSEAGLSDSGSSNHSGVTFKIRGDGLFIPIYPEDEVDAAEEDGMVEHQDFAPSPLDEQQMYSPQYSPQQGQYKVELQFFPPPPSSQQLYQEGGPIAAHMSQPTMSPRSMHVQMQMQHHHQTPQEGGGDEGGQHTHTHTQEGRYEESQQRAEEGMGGGGGHGSGEGQQEEQGQVNTGGSGSSSTTTNESGDQGQEEEGKEEAPAEEEEEIPIHTITNYAGQTVHFYKPSYYEGVICFPTRYFHTPQPPLPLPYMEMERLGMDIRDYHTQIPVHYYECAPGCVDTNHRRAKGEPFVPTAPPPQRQQPHHHHARVPSRPQGQGLRPSSLRPNFGHQQVQQQQ